MRTIRFTLGVTVLASAILTAGCSMGPGSDPSTTADPAPPTSTAFVADSARDTAVRAVALTGAVAAVSVGIVQGTPLLDLEYTEDSDCDTDMNVVMTGAGHFIELQGTAEGAAFSRHELDALLALADKGIAELLALQRQSLLL